MSPAQSYAEQIELAVRIIGGERKRALMQLRDMEPNIINRSFITRRIAALNTKTAPTQQTRPDFPARSEQPLRDMLIFDALVGGDASLFRRMVVGKWGYSPDHVTEWLKRWNLTAHPIIQDLIDRSMTDAPTPGTKLKRPGS